MSANQVPALKNYLAAAINNGLAARIQTIVVSPEMENVLKSDLTYKGMIKQSARKGNVRVTYTFNVISHPYWNDMWAPQEGFYAVPYTPEEYQQYLQLRSIALSTMGIEISVVAYERDGLWNIDPVFGQVIHNKKLIPLMSFKAAEAALALDPAADLNLLTFNTPQIEWMGSVEAFERGKSFFNATAGCKPFISSVVPQLNLGFLYIYHSMFRGWKVEVSVSDPYAISNTILVSGPKDAGRFAISALNYFRPEEVYLAIAREMGLGYADGIAPLGALQALAPTPNWLGEGSVGKDLGIIQKLEDGSFRVRVVDTSGVYHQLSLELYMGTYVINRYQNQD